MAFYEVRFPERISYGSRGGPGFNTAILRTDSGAEARVARWDTPIHQYDVSYGIRTHQELYDVKQFYWAVRGSLHGFRFKDWGDYATTPSGNTDERSGSEEVDDGDVIIGTGDGATRDFQLVKLYLNAFATSTRVITKPVQGTVRVAVAGAAQTEGSHFTVNYASGLVTFGTAPASGRDVTAGFEFDVPVRFGQEADQALQSTITSFGAGDIDAIPLEEIINGLTVPDHYFHGGFYSHGDIAVSVSMELSQGFLHEVRPTVMGLKARLPRADDISAGGIVIAVVNNGSEDIDVDNFDETATALTLPPGGIGEFLIAEDSGGAKTWLGK